MQNCITLDIFADNSQKKEFLTPVKIWLLIFIYSTHSVKISWPPVIYYRNYGWCFLGRCARFGIFPILWKNENNHYFTSDGTITLKLSQKQDIRKKSDVITSYDIPWRHSGTCRFGHLSTWVQYFHFEACIRLETFTVGKSDIMTSFYSIWRHLGTYRPATCYIWGSINQEKQNFQTKLWFLENSMS